MRTEPNDLLRRARQSRLSPTGSGRSMSRQELAEAVNAWVFQHLQQRVDFDGARIGKLERGQTRWPRAHVRAGLRAVLGAEKDADLGLYNMYGAERTAEAADRDPAAEPIRDMPAVAASSRHASAGPADTAGRITREQVDQAHTDLGERLAHWRKSAGLTQTALAERVRYSRSTVANVEIGRHNIRRDFWQRADTETSADGVLLACFDQACELSSAWRVQAARQRHQHLQDLAESHRRAPDPALPPSAAPGDVSFQGHTLTPAHAVATTCFTLTVTATGSGRVRLVIETDPSDDPDAGAGSHPNGARVYSMAQARQSRTGHPA